MALEKIFDCPKALAKLRSGPLGKLLEGFSLWLLKCGFTRHSIRTHLSHLSHLNEHLGGPAAPPRKSVSSNDIAGFLKAYRSQCRNRGTVEAHLRRVRHSINRFTAYLREKGLFDPLEQSPSYQPLLDAYLAWLRTYQQASPGTLALRRHNLCELLRWLGPRASMEGLSELTAEDVEQFFLGRAQTRGQAARRSLQAALRTFFRFCVQRGYIQRPLDQAVPTLRTYKLATVPRALSEEQAQQVLQSIDRRTDAGRRDYAIVQLLYTFGVRGGQVRALRVEDIRWADNQILFRAMKQGKDTLLPLTLEVGESLLEYLQKARPPCAYPQVFLTCRAPYHPLHNCWDTSTALWSHNTSASRA